MWARKLFVYHQPPSRSNYFLVNAVLARDDFLDLPSFDGFGPNYRFGRLNSVLIDHAQGDISRNRP